MTYTNNRLTAWPGGFTYEFDADGNTTRRRKTTAPATDARFYWSPDGLLDSTVTSNGRRLTYEYNAFGQLARRRTNGTIDRHFAWDQDHLLIEMSGALTQRVYEYAGLPGTDRLLAVLCCETLVSAIYFAYQDVQGSLVGLVSSAGSVFRRQTDSDPWGFVGVWGPTAFPAGIRTRWQGLMHEADSTQLYYVRARWYDPRTKRFMSPDPIGLSGGINPYAFAGNDPVNLGDASGMIAGTRGPCSLLLSCGGFDLAAYFGGMLGTDEGGGGGRPLNDAERQALGNLCKRRPDICAKARIYTSSEPNLSLLASLVGAMTRATNRPFTPGTVLFIPERREGDLALLAHELTHVGQFLDWGATAFIAAGIRSMTRERFGINVYDIPGGDPLYSVRFGQWGMEQQGNIVRDCFRGRSPMSCAVSPYKP